MLGRPKYARNAADLYETPEWCTEVLCRHVKLTHVWEPACGPGKMVAVLRPHALSVRSSDMVDYGWAHEVRGFLECQEPWTGEIVTNPPYSIATEFVRHALDLVKGNRGSKVAMLLRNEWDCAGSERPDLFAECPHFAKKIVLTRRPRWIAGTTGSPRHNYAWFVWEIGRNAPPEIVYDQ